MDGSWGKYHGKPIEKFQVAFSEFLISASSASTDFALFVWPCASGTIAVELALRGLGVGPGDQVILAGYDFPGNFRAVEAIGARPVLVDVVENGFVLDPQQVQLAVNESTKAVIVSHLHGQLADVTAIKSICQNRSIGMLEDACQVPGATVAGRPAGTWGDVGVFSFGGSKLLTAGRGGAVVTKDEGVLQRIKIAAERGNDAYPLSALQAAALTPQLRLLPEMNQLRLDGARQLRSMLEKMNADKNVPHPFALPEDVWNEANSPAFYKFPLLIRADHSTCSRQTLIESLVAKGVPADIGFRGFAVRSRRRCDRVGELPNSKLAAANTILLHHPFLTGGVALVEQVAKAIEKVSTT